MHNLMWLFTIPFVFSAAAFVGCSIQARLFKWLAFFAALVPMFLLIAGGQAWIGTDVRYAWMPALHVNFHLGIDALSLLFMFLSAFVVLVSIVAVRSAGLSRPNVFYGLLFLLEGLLFGFFTAKDLALFTFFWESILIPLYFMIVFWGHQQRFAAALKFLIYMVAGSCLMVAAVLFLFFSTGALSFDMETLAKVAENSHYAPLIFGIFLVAFAVKTPLFPFHAWLPDTYYQASTSGTILLAAILSKAGVYGILRVGLGFFSQFIISWSPVLIGLAITGVLYGALAAWRQTDYKRLIAYSSFSHVNFILAGLFIWSEMAHTGAILQAVNHGITIAALFLSAEWLERRIHTTTIGTFTGLSSYFPRLCWISFVFVLSSVSLPSTNNFIGELLILLGLFQVNPWWAAILASSVVLSVIYMLFFMQKVYFESPSQRQSNWSDLSLKEVCVAIPLIVLIFWIGLYPQPILNYADQAVNQILSVAQPKETQ